MRRIVLLGAVLVVAVGAGCKGKVDGPNSSAFPGATVYVLEDSGWRVSHGKDANFILYVSNQSFAISPVDIKVSLDAAVAIDKKFSVNGKFPAHNWKRFQFCLAEGVHHARVTSVKGKAKLEREFEIKDKRWAAVSYWPSGLNFRIQDAPMHFL